MISVSQNTFTEEVLNSRQRVIVNFWAPWCGLCHLITPVLQKFQSQNGVEIKVVGINADNNLKLANLYSLKSLPTLLVFEQGSLVYRLEGFRSRDDIYQKLNDIRAVLSLSS